MTEPIELKQIAPMRGRGVKSSDGKNLGRIDAIHYDGLKKDAEWVEIKVGRLFGEKRYLVPLEGAVIDRDVLVLPFSQKQVTDEPRFDTWTGLTAKVEETYNQHFGTDPINRYRVMEVMREGDFAEGIG
jgi:hypothetical protein